MLLSEQLAEIDAGRAAVERYIKSAEQMKSGPAPNLPEAQRLAAVVERLKDRVRRLEDTL